MNASLYNTETDPSAPRTTAGVAASGTNTYYSSMIYLDRHPGFSVDVVTTGTLAGTWTLWRTNKPNPSLADDTDWFQEAAFAPTNPAGAATKWSVDANGTRHARYRLKYVNASGAGNLFVYAEYEGT